MKDVVIELQNVKKVYKTGAAEVYALNGVSMSVERGDFIAIMGPSGSGKSTLLNLIGCLDKPTEGRVIINGVDTSNLTDKQLTELRRDTIGFIFQHYNLIPTLTAFENVELPMIFKGVPKAEREERARELLKLVGLEREMHRKPKELSGGQQQRVAIARALANKPSILLCDEPTGNLDTKSGRAIMEIIKGLNEEGVTVVLVTHDPAVAGFAERVVRIVDGVLVESVQQV
ncbi:ABC transporter ATP-binding protein [Archaeoglobus veneficus]|uniref:Phosphonate-transporting ATPase n=1 Tax=Archaeoglobus veneficus (strain DSM 11195 / SNP6) TaxID=693661 RepID=F2KRR0_ARCVS|nr:ABC transporter ATP-binding protein [Archaeoglobus veneficus]AEA47924.1 Phosphonate-transporting ATPase [Archaeoglobus veneficus SNP6]